MRRTINHVGPLERQDMPADNTSAYVMAQVRLWSGVHNSARYAHLAGTLIHPQSAMEIASWWASPGAHGIGMAQFASTGTVTEALLDDITREIEHAQIQPVDAAMADGTGYRDKNIDALRALDAYVRACTVPVWTVGRNIAGYLPESDVTPFLDYADAVDYFRTEVEQAPDALADDEDCTCVDGGELCEFDSLDAEVRAYLTDDVPSVVNGRVFGGERELSIALRPDSASLPTVYWLNRSEMTVAEYIASREGN